MAFLRQQHAMACKDDRKTHYRRIGFIKLQQRSRHRAAGVGS
jgi:hypothetical protein